MGPTNFQIVLRIYSERLFFDNFRTVRNYSEICGWFQKDRRFLLYPVPPWIIPPYSVFLYQLLSSKNISLSIVPFSQYNSTLYQLLCPAKTFVFFWGGGAIVPSNINHPTSFPPFPERRRKYKYDINCLTSTIPR